MLLSTSSAAGATTLLASLNGVDLALGKLAGTDTTVGLTVLALAVVLCIVIMVSKSRVFVWGVEGEENMGKTERKFGN